MSEDHCKRHTLYVEEYERFHGEPDGDYVVMCTDCDWADKYVFYGYSEAVERMESILETTEYKSLSGGD